MSVAMEYDKPRRKLSASDSNNALRRIPSGPGPGPGSQGSTAGGSSSGNQPFPSSPDNSNSFGNNYSYGSGSGSGSAGVDVDSMTTTSPHSKQHSHPQPSRPRKPYIRQRHGRGYLEAPGISYPLPVDLPEIHRQALRTMFLTEVFGAPTRSPLPRATPATANTHPKRMRILDVGCGSGIWSLLCHRYLRRLGHTNVSFTGIDIAPPESQRMSPDDDMDWTYVQLDVNQRPWPFPDGYFDLVFIKELTLAVLEPQHASFAEEAQRVLMRGGYLEVWEVDHLIRLLRPHTPNDEDRDLMGLGAYRLRVNTPLSAPLNTYLNEYNHWLSLALAKRDVMANPCTSIKHILLCETSLVDVQSCRLVVPFGEIRWEGQGGVAKVVTKDGKAYVDTSSRGPKSAPTTVSKADKPSGSPLELTEIGQSVRKTALQTLVQEIQAQELMLREVNGKGQDEWNTWMDRMTHDLLEEGGTSWGECLEAGAWWAKKQ